MKKPNPCARPAMMMPCCAGTPAPASSCRISSPLAPKKPTNLLWNDRRPARDQLSIMAFDSESVWQTQRLSDGHSTLLVLLRLFAFLNNPLLGVARHFFVMTELLSVDAAPTGQ